MDRWEGQRVNTPDHEELKRIGFDGEEFPFEAESGWQTAGQREGHGEDEEAGIYVTICSVEGEC